MLSKRDIRQAMNLTAELAEACETAQDALTSLRDAASNVIAAHDNDDEDALADAVADLKRELS